VQYSFRWLKEVMTRVPDIQIDEVKVSILEDDEDNVGVQVRYHFVDNPEFITTFDYTVHKSEVPEDILARGEWPEGATFT
jgi:hypothetical protein